MNRQCCWWRLQATRSTVSDRRLRALILVDSVRLQSIAASSVPRVSQRQPRTFLPVEPFVGSDEGRMTFIDPMELQAGDRRRAMVEASTVVDRTGTSPRPSNTNHDYQQDRKCRRLSSLGRGSEKNFPQRTDMPIETKLVRHQRGHGVELHWRRSFGTRTKASRFDGSDDNAPPSGPPPIGTPRRVVRNRPCPLATTAPCLNHVGLSP